MCIVSNVKIGKNHMLSNRKAFKCHTSVLMTDQGLVKIVGFPLGYK